MPLAPGVYDFRRIAAGSDNAPRVLRFYEPGAPVLPCEKGGWTIRVRLITDSRVFPEGNVPITLKQSGKADETRNTRFVTAQSAEVSWKGTEKAECTATAALKGWTLESSQKFSVRKGDDKLVILKLSTHWLRFRLVDQKDGTDMPNVRMHVNIPFEDGLQLKSQSTDQRGLGFKCLNPDLSADIVQIGTKDDLDVLWEVVSTAAE